MRKKIVIIVLGLSILITFFSGMKLNQAYSPLPTIYYDGHKKEFTYFNINNNDLFTNLKEIMPGDVKEQEILFKIDNIRKNTKIFLNINKNIEQKLLQYIKIYVDNKELIGNEEYIELGAFSKDNEIKLKVVIEVPKEVGNEIENLKYNMDWKLLIQEENEELLEVPQTYDDSNIIIYFIIAIVALCCMIYSILILSKSK